MWEHTNSQIVNSQPFSFTLRELFFLAGVDGITSKLVNAPTMIDIERFVQLRGDKKLSQTGLAKAAGMSQQLIGEIEAGRVRSTKAIYKIANALGTTASLLDPDIPAVEGNGALIAWVASGLDSKRGKTQTGLADALGVSQPRISEILNGKRRLQATEVPKIAEYIGRFPPSEWLKVDQPEPAATSRVKSLRFA
jgi:transcriptional regulator with XRE-family HTH domain